MSRYIVVTAHQSEYPEPIHFQRGTTLQIGEKYQGPEDWQDWYFCHTDAHPGGWMPRQVFRLTEAGQGVALQDYSAKELNVAQGDLLEGTRTLNGWLWAQHLASKESGGVPLENLQIQEG